MSESAPILDPIAQGARFLQLAWTEAAANWNADVTLFTPAAGKRVAIFAAYFFKSGIAGVTGVPLIQDAELTVRLGASVVYRGLHCLIAGTNGPLFMPDPQFGDEENPAVVGPVNGALIVHLEGISFLGNPGALPGADGLFRARATFEVIER